MVFAAPDGRILLSLDGRPGDPTWTEVPQGAARTMDRVRTVGLRKLFGRHRRGDFIALGDGVSFGGGQKVCIAFLCWT